MSAVAESAAPWRDALAHYIEQEAKPIEKFGHQPRLYLLAQQVGAGLEYDDDVVYAAAWLHDLGVFCGHRPDDPEQLVRWDNVAYAADRAPVILRELCFPYEKLAAVVDVIRTHLPSSDPISKEGVILRDADILEQLGSIGILRTVCKIGRDTRFATFTQAVDALQRALRELPGKLQLPTARKLAEPRIDMLSAFLEHAESESSGQLY